MRSVSLAEGIVLRAYDPSDAGQLLVAVDGARDRLARWMPWVPFATTVQGFEDFIRVAIRQDRDGSGLHRGLFDSERLIGTVGASIGLLNFDEADVGYWLAESHEGHGLASLATGHLIERLFGERDMHRITMQRRYRQPAQAHPGRTPRLYFRRDLARVTLAGRAPRGRSVVLTASG